MLKKTALPSGRSTIDTSATIDGVGGHGGRRPVSGPRQPDTIDTIGGVDGRRPVSGPPGAIVEGW